MSGGTNPSHSELVQRVAQALDDGSLSEHAVEEMLAGTHPATHERPGALHLLLAIGVLVIYFGMVLAYAVGFGDYSNAVQLVTPFIFPVVAWGGVLWLQRVGRAYWMRESATLIAFVSLAGASIAAAFGAQSEPDAGWISAWSIVWGIVAFAATRILRDLRTPWDALIVSLIVCINTLGIHAEWEVEVFSWINVGLAAALTAVAIFAATRRSHRFEEAALAGAIGTTYIATVVALGQSDIAGTNLSGWHVLITASVASAFVLAPALRMPLLYAVGAVGAFLWLSFVIPIAVQSAGWALIVVAMGALLVGISIAGALVRGRLQNRRS